MRTMEHVQLDPLAIIARAQDLMLHSRVIDYTPTTGQTLTYERRRFFDWGGWLAVRPMAELPALARAHAPRARERPPGGRSPDEHAAAIAEMREILRTPPGGRQPRLRDGRPHAGGQLSRSQGQRHRALLPVAHRRGDDHPPRALRAGLCRGARGSPRGGCSTKRATPRPTSSCSASRSRSRASAGWRGGRDLAPAPVPPSDVACLARAARLADGTLIEVRVEGWTGPRWALASDARGAARARTRARAAGWSPLDTTTDGGDHVPRAARPGQRPRSGQAAVWLRLHVGGLQAGRASASSATTRCRSCGATGSSPASTASSTGRPGRSTSWACGWRTRPWRPTRRSSRRSPGA